MALTKEIIEDKIEVVGEHKHVQIRSATIVKEDGVQISKGYSRKVLDPGVLDGSGNLVDRNISGESAEVQAICNGVWTNTVKDAWKARLVARTNEPRGSDA
jgi:hypothetical protein